MTSDEKWHMNEKREVQNLSIFGDAFLRRREKFKFLEKVYNFGNI